MKPKDKTTIIISKDTRKILNVLKQDKGLSNVDELIRFLVTQDQKEGEKVE